MARKTIIAGNWKMNLLPEEAETLVMSLAATTQNKPNLEVVVFPPAPMLALASDWVVDSGIQFGAQNCWYEFSGAFTGELSPELVKVLGCRYCLVGHSERREIFEETNELVGRKTKALIEMGVTPVVCVGETLAEREAGTHLARIEEQVGSAFDALESDAWLRVVLAYEPVWAIGTGKTATPEQANEIHQHIRELVRKKAGDTLAAGISILYGGSAKPSNAAELLQKDHIDGLLVGGASLKVEDFSNIISAF